MKIAELITWLFGLHSHFSREGILGPVKPRGPRSGFVCLVVLTAMLFAIPRTGSQEAQSSKPEAAILRGVVRDSVRNPVSGAHVALLTEPSGDPRDALTDVAGSFTFSGIFPGTFTLTADLGTMRSAAVKVVIPQNAHPGDQQPTVDLVLSTSTPPSTATAPADASESMQFADKPDFAIAAVTDWTAAGGHGSDASLRASEALTRDAVKLPDVQQRAKGADSANTEWEKRQEDELRAAVAKNPKDPAANHKLGRFYLRAQSYQDAVHYLQSAYDTDSKNFENELDLADAFKLAGHPLQSREHVQNLLASHDTAELHRMNGELEESLGDPLGAAHEFQLAASADPSENNYFAWGSELLIHRAIWQAKQIFDEGARRYPTSVRMLTARGAALFAGALYDDSALDLCSASDLDPGSVQPYLFMGKIEIAAPNPLPCVLEKLARFQKLQPTNPLADYYYAMALKKQQGSEGDQHVMEQVKDLLTKAVALDSNCAVAYLELGNLSAGSKQWEQAIDFYLKAIQADADLSDAHYRLGVAYRRSGKQDLAKEQFQLHDEIAKRQAAEVQQQREAVKQFVVVLPGQNNPAQAR